MFSERGIELHPQIFKPRLDIIPNHIDFGVIRDRSEGDMRRPVVNKALANVVVGRYLDLNFTCDALLSRAALWRVSKVIIGVLRAHDTLSLIHI